MKQIALLLALTGTIAIAQTPTTPAPKPKSAAATSSTSAAHKATTPATPKLPPGVPPVKGPVKVAFTTTLRYQDITVGTGASAEPGKLYKVFYTGYLASDGTVFDSTDKHRSPVLDKDHKPVNGPDGKPQLGDPQPFAFPQGSGRLIPGWDQGFDGMKAGGKRRLFIPYRLAYGELGRAPVIPAKSDLIFDIELISVEDVPARPPMGMPARPMPPRPGAANSGAPSAPPAGAASPAPATGTAAPNPASPATPAPATPAQTPPNPAQPK